MEPHDPKLLEAVRAISSRACAAIMAIYSKTSIQTSAKADQSPLTEADLAAHRVIAEGLRELTPDIPLLSEEDSAGFGGPNESQRYWLIDPLDGTKEFLSRNGEFTVNIALIEQGRPVLGVVSVPATGVHYLAAAGLGAFREDSDGTVCPLQVAHHEPGTPWRVVGSRSHAGDSLRDFLEKLGHHELLPMGSSLKFCLVAEGRADLYPRFGPTHYWDTAAAQCILEQAGGTVIAPNGDSLVYYSCFPSTLNPFFLASGNGIEEAQTWFGSLTTGN